MTQEFLLKDDNKKIDGGEEWLKVNVPVPFEIKEGALEGEVSGLIRDLNARFPLNNLTDENGAPNEDYVKALQRLVDNVLAAKENGNTENSSAGLFNPDLAKAVQDWLDKDGDSAPGGAEDGEYLGLEVPYRTANGEMRSVSELRLISKVIADEYTRLVPSSGGAPFVNTLPGHKSSINVNTAPKEVLMSIDDKISSQVADVIISTREEELFPENPAGKIESIIKEHGDFADENEKNKYKLPAKILLSAGSEYFELTATASIGNMRVNLVSVLKREDNKVTVVQRSLGGY